MLTSGLAILAVAVAPAYAGVFIGAMLGGVPNGWTNPATNSLIVDNTELGSRGVVTGIKQSGVQAGTFLGGLLLPTLSDAFDWRIAFACFLVFPLIGWLGMLRRPVATRSRNHEEQGADSVPSVVRWLALYGMITGLCLSSILTFLPLFAEETQGWTTAQAGLLVAAISIVGVVARITWGPISERRLGHGRALRWLAVISALSALLLTLTSAGVIAAWALVPCAVLLGVGAASWTAVGMLAVMDYSPRALVGRGTGLIMLGYLAGVGLGPPIMGLSVDRLGSYSPGWLVLTVLFATSILVATRVRHTGTLDPR
jgi:MFS family permease